ncbi:MAG: hypothetical protein QXH69_02400, partial [Candidatus Micrarchaeaceae archaeon]
VFLMSILLVGIEAFLAILVPGVLLSFALLKKTNLHTFEIVAIGFMFGLIFPPVMTWLESYLIPYIHAFSFSAGLYNINVVVLTIIGIVLCFQQGVFSIKSIRAVLSASPSSERRSELSKIRENIKLLNIDTELIKEHQAEEESLKERQRHELEALKGAPEEERQRIIAMHNEELSKLISEHEAEERLLLQQHRVGINKPEVMWSILLLLMLFTFVTRLASIGIAPIFFEFDPYYDMISTQYILTYGYQLLYDHAAWPTVANGVIHRIQPIVPYLEAYWYDLANSALHYSTLSTNLLSLVSSFYPPIVAALLVFIVFMFLYHDYGAFPALVGAAFAAAMPVLITTFIAGEQLLEPWGIFAMFFFYATYLLAAKYPKEKRYAILAGIAYASNFLGAHYYTVIAGVLSIYIVLQGLLLVLKRMDTRDFYKMNIIVIVVFTIFYLVYSPYGATLTERIPSMLGLPVIISFPVVSLIFIAFLEYLPLLLKREKLIKEINIKTYLAVLILLGVIVLILAAFTSLGTPIRTYIALSKHFVTPSTPLFMTVQEFEPTGLNFNFGAAGFGIIGASVGGVDIIIWAVLIIFTLFELVAMLYRNSSSAILALAAVWPLAIAAMSEVKYLPHFGVAYIIAISIIIAEAVMFIRNDYKLVKRPEKPKQDHAKAIKYFTIFIFIVVVVEWLSVSGLISAALNPNCNTIANSGNSLGYDLYCNVVPNAWLKAAAWMRANVGPFGPRLLSWWDYGDWINWFGNSNAVLRGDNAVPTLDYRTAAIYVLGPADGFGYKALSSFMDSVQAKYVIFDNELQQKWGALDFLACVDVNQTSEAFAEQAGASVGQPYVLGTSTCELKHDPVYALIPASVSSVSQYCTFANSSVTAVKALAIAGPQLLNITYCVPTSIYTSSAPVYLYSTNGTRLNALIVPSSQFYYGVTPVSGANFFTFMVLYTPNAPNDTITDAPTEFYMSNYYRGFFFGYLPGYHLAYPSNFTGMNYVNSTNEVMILALNNYTGGLPYVTPKPAWVHNNYTIPG